jgi:hypothetical protein
MRAQDAVSQALQLLEAAENERGWERPPRIHLIYLEPNGDVASREVLIPDGVRAAVSRPPELLYIIARFIEEDAQAPPLLHQLGPFACSFMAEVWQVRPKPGLPAEVYERMLAAADRRELSKHPGRQEVRGLWAMDREGWFYELQRPRHGEQSVSVVSLDDPNLKAVGLIPDALRRISEKLR